jgi:hypothetical protein
MEIMTLALAELMQMAEEGNEDQIEALAMPRARL